MPALFVIAHAPLASALRSAARHVFPEVVAGLAACDVRIAVGVNVPMLWRSITYRDRPLDELLALALAGARMGVMQAADSSPPNRAPTSGGDGQDDRNDQQ